MSKSTVGQSWERAKLHAFYSLTWRERQGANLLVSRSTIPVGTRLGPPFQEIVVEEPSILVFIDLEPGTGFAHRCRYLLYGADTGAFLRAYEAQFPPFVALAKELQTFHEGIPDTPHLTAFRLPPPLLCPSLIPDGERYAILFSGLAYPANLNDLEFSYRTLIDRYGFRPENVHVHLWDGMLATAAGPAGVWPGDATPFRIQISGPGTRAGVQLTLNGLKGRLKRHDLLFLHTENEATPLPESSLVESTYGIYRASELAADIAALPRHRSFIAVMASCYSAGFSASLIASSQADNTCVSCASAGGTAFSPPGWQFMKFGSDWLTAQMGHDPFGALPSFDPDSDANGVIEAEEAFAYAYMLRSPIDTATFSETSEAGGDITLGQRSEWLWWWCRLLEPILEPYYRRLPPREFYSKLQIVLPQLQKSLGDFGLAADALRKQSQPRFESILASAFEQ